MFRFPLATNIKIARVFYSRPQHEIRRPDRTRCTTRYEYFRMNIARLSRSSTNKRCFHYKRQLQKTTDEKIRVTRVYLKMASQAITSGTQRCVYARAGPVSDLTPTSFTGTSLHSRTLRLPASVAEIIFFVFFLMDRMAENFARATV